MCIYIFTCVHGPNLIGHEQKQDNSYFRYNSITTMDNGESRDCIN